MTGSDRQRSSATERLESPGSWQYDHSPLYLKETELMIYSSAIRKTILREVCSGTWYSIHAPCRGPWTTDEGALHDLYCGYTWKDNNNRTGWAVFQDAGMDPVVLVGGVIRGAESHAVTGTGNIMVAEADEYDRSFLAMYPLLL